MPLATVRDVAGHASLATTDRYARMAQAAQLMNSSTSSYMKGGATYDDGPKLVSDKVRGIW